jgi:hypothetical protein
MYLETFFEQRETPLVGLKPHRHTLDRDGRYQKFGLNSLEGVKRRGLMACYESMQRGNLPGNGLLLSFQAEPSSGPAAARLLGLRKVRPLSGSEDAARYKAPVERDIHNAFLANEQVAFLSSTTSLRWIS